MVFPTWFLPVMSVVVLVVFLLTIARLAMNRNSVAGGVMNVIYYLIVGTLVAGLAIGGAMYMKKMQKDAVSDRP